MELQYIISLTPLVKPHFNQLYMELLRPNTERAKVAITLIWIVLFFDIISFISSYMQYDLLQTVSNGGFITTDEANNNDLREQVIAISYMIVNVISAVTFIMWFRRAYFNLHLRINNLSHTEGWAAGCWFVPIICLYRPYQIMKELYQDSKLLLMQHESDGVENFNTQFLGTWWTMWIINNFIGQFVFKYSMKAESIDELTTSTIASMVGNCTGIVLAIITVKIIMDYSKIEPLLRDLKTEDDVDKNIDVSLS